jgi:glutaminase
VVATGVERDGRGVPAGAPPVVATGVGVGRLVSPVLAHLERLHARHATDRSGVVASYIPELAKADSAWFGICIATVDGAVYEVGDTRRPFTLQSISKPLTYGLAVADLGEPAVRARIGVEPTGDAFNAITLSPERGIPLNPMVNAGAIAAAGLVGPRAGRSAFERTRDAYDEWAGRPLDVDEAVYRSERETGHRNRAIAHLLCSTGALDGDPDEAVDRYFGQCSVAVDARDLALIGATLAAGGRHPLTGRRVADSAVVRAMLSVMATCGMYDGAGEWLFDIGLPAKSGVSGGIVAVLPGQLGIAVFSPPLDPRGNSVRGVAVCRELASGLDLHLVADGRSGGDPIRSRGDLVARRSTRSRPAAEQARLATVGTNALVLELHGELTFLAAETVARTVEERPVPPGMVLLDLRRVGRVDRGAGPILRGLGVSLAATGGRLAMAGRDEALGSLFGDADGHVASILRFADIDEALEWAEECLLGTHERRIPASTIELADHDLIDGIGPHAVARLLPYLAVRRWAAGEIVLRRGDPADELVLLVSGGATASIGLAGGGRRRLSTVVAGSVLGELAFLGTERRTADVTADTPLEAFVLTGAAFADMGRQDPALKAAVLENLVRTVVRVARRMTDEVASLAG